MKVLDETEEEIKKSEIIFQKKIELKNVKFKYPESKIDTIMRNRRKFEINELLKRVQDKK